MSLRKRLTAENALSVALATTAVTRELADMCQFPPVRAAAGLLLLIFQTIQDIQTNRTECYRLARRSLALLTDLRETMHARCQDAPPSLLLAIHKFEHTLEEIHTALKASAEHKWHSRLIKKNSIEAAIADFNLQLDDAARSFQIATLINIQYELATSAPLCESPTTPEVTQAMTRKNNLPPMPSAQSTAADNQFVLVSTSGARPTAQSLHQQLRDTTTEGNLTEAIAQMTKDLKDHGFRRFHTSDLSFTSSSAISTATDWWSTARDGVTLRTTTDDANSSYSESVLYIPYHSGTRTAAAQKWLQDVKILQNVHHPNLPQMIGYSGDSAPTPFILLANVQTRLPQALVLDAIQNASLLSCARLLIRYYKDIFDASLYIQRQLGLSESKTQDYVENASLRIDASDTMVLGLPPPDIHNWTSYRNYGLAHSIREIFLKILPNHGYARQPYDPDSTTSLEVQQKVSHLAVLAKSLLPSSDDTALVSSRLSSILYYSRPSIPFSRDDDDDDEGEEEEDHDGGRIAKGQPTAGLAKIRMAAILANTHSHTWARNVVPAYMYAVGDIGYVPRGGEDFTSFVVLSNVFTDAERFNHPAKAHGLGVPGVGVGVVVSESAHGWQRYLQGAFQEQKLQPFALPQNVSGWPIVMSAGTRQNVQLVHERSFTSVSAAWKVLLEHAKPIATSHGLEPQDLMLITRAGIDQRFVVHDLRSPPPPLHNPHLHSPHHHRPGFPQHPHPQMMHGYGAGGHRPPGFSGFPAPPALFYLFTSPEQGFEPYISETPMYVPVPEGTKRPDVRQCLCGMEGTYGFMNYVQLHAEDFV